MSLTAFPPGRAAYPRTVGQSEPPPRTGGRPGKAAGKLPPLFRRFGLDETRAVLSQQTHTANIRTVTAEDVGRVCLSPGLHRCGCSHHQRPRSALTVFSADCGTVLLYDPVHQAIGAVHAGWRGCAAGIVEKTVAAMVRPMGAVPTICWQRWVLNCCFETDGDVPEAMQAALGAIAAPSQ